MAKHGHELSKGHRARHYAAKNRTKRGEARNNCRKGTKEHAKREAQFAASAGRYGH